MRVFSSVFLFCVLMGGGGCLGTSESLLGRVGGAVRTGVGLAVKHASGFLEFAADVFDESRIKVLTATIPDVHLDDYTLERLVRIKMLRHLGSSRPNPDAMAKFLGLNFGWQVKMGLASMPDVVSEVLSQYREGQHWNVGVDGRTIHALHFFDHFSDQPSHDILLKLVIAQHVCDKCENSSDIYKQCQIILGTLSLVERSKGGIYRQCLQEQCNHDAKWLADLYVNAEQCPQGLKKKRHSFVTLMRDIDSKWRSYDINVCQQQLAALENEKRQFCRSSQLVHKNLIRTGVLQAPSMMSAVVNGLHDKSETYSQNEWRYEEAAEALAGVWKEKCDAGHGAEPALLANNDASVGPAGAGSGAGAGVAIGRLEEQALRMDVTKSIEDLILFCEALGVVRSKDYLDQVAAELKSTHDAPKALQQLTRFFECDDFRQEVISGARRQLDDSSGWVVTEGLGGVYAASYIRAVFDAACTANGAITSAAHGAAYGDTPTSADSTPILSPASLTPGSGLEVVSYVPSVAPAPALEIHTPPQMPATPVAAPVEPEPAAMAASLLVPAAPEPQPFVMPQSAPAAILHASSSPVPSPRAVEGPVTPAPAAILEVDGPASPPVSFTSGFLVPRGSQPDLSVTPSPAPVASVPASPAAPERPHTAPSSPVASPRAAEGPVTPAPLMPAAPAATHEGGLRDRAESDLGLDWLFGKNNDDWMDSNSGPLATHTTPAALPSNPATPPAQPKNNGAANGISTLGGLVTAGSLGYLIAELVKSKEVQAVVGRAFKKLAGKKVAPLTGRQRRIAQRLGLDAGVAGAGMLAGLAVLICGRSMRRRV